MVGTKHLSHSIVAKEVPDQTMRKNQTAATETSTIVLVGYH